MAFSKKLNEGEAYRTPNDIRKSMYRTIAANEVTQIRLNTEAILMLVERLDAFKS